MADFDRDAVIATIRAAGALALNSWRAGQETSARIWQKEKSGPVCEADLAVDAMLRDRLGALLPDAGWLSEETTDDPARLERPLIWIVDPIDGTRDYVRGLDGWAVSVALIADRRPLFGALYAPVQQQLWLAHAGEGASRNGVPLRASQRTDMAGARMPSRKLPDQLSDVVAVDCPNSIALRMAKVAADEADILPSVRWGAEWDVAAADLIAREAGAIVTDAHGAPFAYNGVSGQLFGLLCAAPALHAPWLDRMQPWVEQKLREQGA